MRVYLIANFAKPRVRPAVDALLPWLSKRAEVVRVDGDASADLSAVEMDVVLAFGGDGTLLSAARRLVGRPVPLMGVNFGRLGFLASFRPEEFQTQFEAFRAGKLPTSRRMQLEASLLAASCRCDAADPGAVAAGRKFVATALNDAVIINGQPFRMIELIVGTEEGDGHASGVHYMGDGVIVATASGSTAYSLSAGGPIVDARVEAMCVTPICPHSLSFRPVVVNANQVVTIVAERVNPGTTLSCDGQRTAPLCAGDRVVVRRSPHDVLLVENPASRQWRTLAEKLNWAAQPNYNPRR